MADIEYWSIPEILWNTNFITLLKIGSLWQRKSLATSNSLIKIPSELWTQTRRALVFRWNEKWTREGECKWAILNISESIINQLVFFALIQQIRFLVKYVQVLIYFAEVKAKSCNMYWSCVQVESNVAVAKINFNGHNSAISGVMLKTSCA